MVGTERQASLVLLQVAGGECDPVPGKAVPSLRGEAPKRQEETTPGGAAHPTLCSGPLGLDLCPR